MQELELSLTPAQLNQAYYHFPYFLNNVYPLSFIDEAFTPGSHLDEWARMLQYDKTCILAPRKHSKSMTIYAWLMWRQWHKWDKNYEVLYLSFKQTLAQYHIKRYKQMVANNPIFKYLRDMTPAEGRAKYSTDGMHTHVIEPEGILSFKRGRHPDDIILDDILSDPTTMLDLGVIEKINQRVKEDVLSLPKEGGHVKIIGTAQTPIDFFFDLKKSPGFQWGEFPAVQNWKTKKVLWPQKFPFQRLMEIRDHEIGEKAFQKEYMIKPVWSTDSFFTRDKIMLCVNPKLKSVRELKTKNDVGMGWDIGKHSHPAHISVFEFVPLGKGVDVAIQRHQQWMDGWEYDKQLQHVKMLVDALRVDWVNFDNTRGELEGFYEKGYMDKTKFIPINFTTKTKNAMATQFEKRVINTDSEGKPSPLIELINDQRMINQMLVVTNDLQAIQTHEGHGDSFFSTCLALYRKAKDSFGFLQDPNNVTGLF
jgi:hypothetical protein